ncbi:Aste57867_775 [Aphanomyces stellatus]|uniref:Aste57867_775 protein n=1 Tax=Aphanomyces stellatus TaxID=120398 RepID=A0A485K650_9STRA|nr:hypothetical protein As57867_000774 [Aphanomyces stellatus]VFT77999.1 Aste57867_775 [Aphanomyces stellatus]
MFEEPNRIVHTFLFVAHDERSPIGDHEIRVNGFVGMCVNERITDSATLTRHSMIYLPPITCYGKASPAQIGNMYGLSSTDVEFRETYIERILADAETTYVEGYKAL